MRMKKRTPSGVLFLWLFEHKTLSPRPLSEGVLHNRGASRHRHLERSCMPLWETDRNRSHDTLSREISCRNAARTMRGGDFSTLWRLCIESPSQPKLASSLHNKRLSYWRLTGYGRNDGRVRAGFFIICGEAATTTLGAKSPVKPKNPPAVRPVNPKNLFPSCRTF